MGTQSRRAEHSLKSEDQGPAQASGSQTRDFPGKGLKPTQCQETGNPGDEAFDLGDGVGGRGEL